MRFQSLHFYDGFCTGFSLFIFSFENTKPIRQELLYNNYNNDQKIILMEGIATKLMLSKYPSLSPPTFLKATNLTLIKRVFGCAKNVSATAFHLVLLIKVSVEILSRILFFDASKHSTFNIPWSESGPDLRSVQSHLQ